MLLVDLLERFEIDHLALAELAVDPFAQPRLVAGDIGVPDLVGMRLQRGAEPAGVLERPVRQPRRLVDGVVLLVRALGFGH